jgi:hypothetical protein
MKISKRLKILSIIFSAMIFLIIGAYAFWQYIIPQYVGTRVISEFEDACYSSNPDTIKKLIYQHSGYYRAIQKDGPRELVHLFKKFDQGFEILRTKHYYAIVQGDKSKSAREIISLYLSKHARSNSEENCLESADLVKINGEWKILNYYFAVPPKCLLF